MKNILLITFILGLFIACNSSEKEGGVKIMIGGMLPNRFVESSEYNNKDEIETEKAKLIIASIQSKDFETLQSLFQPSIIKSTETLHDDAIALFDYIIINTYEVMKVRISESASFGDGAGIVAWEVYFKIKVNNIYYILEFVDVRKNYANKNDIGIKSLQFIEEEKRNKYRIQFKDMKPGIFNPARHTISEQ